MSLKVPRGSRASKRLPKHADGGDISDCSGEAAALQPRRGEPARSLLPHRFTCMDYEASGETWQPPAFGVKLHPVLPHVAVDPAPSRRADAGFAELLQKSWAAGARARKRAKRLQKRTRDRDPSPARTRQQPPPGVFPPLRLLRGGLGDGKVTPPSLACTWGDAYPGIGEAHLRSGAFALLQETLGKTVSRIAPRHDTLDATWGVIAEWVAKCPDADEWVTGVLHAGSSRLASIAACASPRAPVNARSAEVLCALDDYLAVLARLFPGLLPSVSTLRDHLYSMVYLAVDAAGGPPLEPRLSEPGRNGSRADSIRSDRSHAAVPALPVEEGPWDGAEHAAECRRRAGALLRNKTYFQACRMLLASLRGKGVSLESEVLARTRTAGALELVAKYWKQHVKALLFRAWRGVVRQKAGDLLACKRLGSAEETADNLRRELADAQQREKHQSQFNLKQEQIMRQRIGALEACKSAQRAEADGLLAEVAGLKAAMAASSAEHEADAQAAEERRLALAGHLAELHHLAVGSTGRAAEAGGAEPRVAASLFDDERTAQALVRQLREAVSRGPSTQGPAEEWTAAELRDLDQFTKLGPAGVALSDGNAEEVADVEAMCAKHYRRLRDTYLCYAVGRGESADDATLSENEFWRMVIDARVIEGGYTRRTLRELFKAVFPRVTDPEQGDTKSCALTPSDWIVALLRVAEGKFSRKYGPAGTGGLAGCFAELLDYHVLLFCCEEEAGAFKAAIYRPAVQRVVLQEHAKLERLFQSFAGSLRDCGQSARPQLYEMSRAELTLLLQDMRWLDGVACSEAAVDHLCASLMCFMGGEPLLFHQFLEVACGLAGFKHPPPHVPLHVKLEKFICEFVDPLVASLPR
ncbi:hypothetical protein DIPPA_21216 [Diplonema papillatum]|nr:hypothetical protein DIPPA_21216 [Diplonema papillatum]